MAYFPILLNGVNPGVVRDIVKKGDITYFCGTFSSVGGVTGYAGLARFNLDGSVDQSWKPTAGNLVKYLFVSEDVTKVYTVGSGSLKKFSTTANAPQTFTALNFNPDAPIIGDGNFIYVAMGLQGGSTSSSQVTQYIAGVAQAVIYRAGIVKIDVTGNSGQGSVDSTFVPLANPGEVGSINAMAQDADYIYIGGTFTKYGNSTANQRLCKVNKTNGQVASDWSQGTGFNAGTVRSIVVGSNSALYAAGSFYSFNGTTKPGVAKISKQGALDTNFASPIASDVPLVGGAISPIPPTKLIEANSSLYLGGMRSRTTAYAQIPGKGIMKSSGLSTFTLDASFDISSGLSQNGTFGTYIEASVLHYDGANFYLGAVCQGGTDIPLYKGNGGSGVNYATTSTPGSVWSIDKATAAVMPLYTAPADTTAPTVTLTSSSVSSGGRSSAAYQDFTATFSETVTGFVVGDITVTNGTLSNFSGSGASYTFRVTPTGYESAPSGVAVTVRIPASVCADAAGNQNTISNLFSYTNDQIRPTVNMFDGAGAQLNSESVRTEKQQVSVSFTESVTGFDVSDISVSGATISDFAISSPTAATFSLKNLAAGSVTFSIAEGQLTDLAGNINYSRVVSFTKLPALEIASQSVASGGSVGLNLGLANAASFQIVEDDAYFFTPNNWRLLIMYFKSTDGRKVLIGANSDQDFAKNFSSVAPPGTQFLLRKMIIRGENGSMLVIPRASIAGASQIDITLT